MFTQHLVPNILPTSVIVLDNASYHKKQKDKPPTATNRKDDIKRWLEEHNIEYDDKDIKKTLLEKVKQQADCSKITRTKWCSRMS